MDEEEILRAFRACPRLDVEQARQHAPDIMKSIEPLADSLCVAWPSVLLAVLVATASLAPEDRFELAPSVTVRSVVWACLLHPGSTNSSGVVGCIADSLMKLCQRDFKDRDRAARAEAEARTGNLSTYQEPHHRDLLAGGGSLAATGIQMAKEGNRGAALVAEPELDNIVQWFTNEVSVDAGAPAKLWDGRVWARGIAEKTRAFTIPRPWMSVLAGGHVPELYKAMLVDKLGLRQRLAVSFPEPTWRTIAQIRKACQDLPVPSHTPEDYVAALLYPVLKSSLRRGGVVYTAHATDWALAA